MQVIHQQAALHGAIRERRLSSVTPPACFEESLGTVLLVVSALICAFDAGVCFNTHVGLHGASSDRKAVIGESLGVV